MTHGQKRRLYTRLIGELIVWVYSNLPDYELQLEEGYINPVRKYSAGGVPLITLNQEQYHHNLKGLHPTGLAHDISLFVKGRYIVSSTDPAWKPVIDKWLSMHEYCRNGKSGNDANHFSFSDNTKW